LKNNFAKEYLELEKKGTPFEELESLGAGRLRLAVKEGEVTVGSVMAGQIAGLIKDIKPCRKIIEDIVKEAELMLKNIASLKGGVFFE